MNATTQATKAIGDDLDQLNQDANTLLFATADMAEAKIDDARRQLTIMLDRSKKMYAVVRQKALKSIQATDVVVHEHLYQAIAIGVGVGALIGFLSASRSTCNRD